MSVKDVLVEYEIDGNNIKLTPSIVSQFLIDSNSEVTIQEFKFFAEMCKVRKLNPFLKEAYIIKYGNNPATMIVGKDAILKRASKNKQYDGCEHGIIVLNTETNLVEYRTGTFYLKGLEQIVGGWAKSYRKDREYPSHITVAFDEYVQLTKQGTPNKFWREKGATMIEKVALMKALKQSFPEDLNGLEEGDDSILNSKNQENLDKSEKIVDIDNVSNDDSTEIIDVEIVNTEVVEKEKVKKEEVKKEKPQNQVDVTLDDTYDF